MGTARAPVVGLGTAPAWTCCVSKPQSGMECSSLLGRSTDATQACLTMQVRFVGCEPLGKGWPPRRGPPWSRQRPAQAVGQVAALGHLNGGEPEPGRQLLELAAGGGRHRLGIGGRLAVGAGDEEPARLPVGLEVETADEVLPDEQGQDVVAEAAEGLGHVDLDPEVEAEEPIRAVARPDERVERRQQRRPAAPPRRGRRGAGRQVARCAPALDGDLDQPAVVDELRHATAGDGRPDPEVVRQVGGRAHAEARRGVLQELALGFLGLGRRPGADLRRHHAVGQVVDPLERRAPPGGQDAVGEEHLHGVAAVAAPVPPRALVAPGVGQLGGGERALLRHLVEDGLEVAGVRLPPGPASLPGRRADELVAPPALHAVAEQRVEVPREQRGGVAPVLEPAAARCPELQEAGGLVGADAAPGHEELRAGQDVDGVELDGADLGHHGIEGAGLRPGPGGSGPSGGEALRAHGQAAGVALRQVAAHPAILAGDVGSVSRHEGRPAVRQLFPGPVRPVDPLAPYAVERPSPASRPWVVVNMVQSVDGSTAVEGVSGPLGGAADRTIFLGLRGLADAVLVGASTVRAERYGPVRARPEARAARLARGQRPVATLAVVTRSLELDYAAPLFTAAEAETVLLVPEDADEAAVAGASGPSAVIRVGTGSVDLARALEALRGRGVRLLVCEGGPHLNAGLAAAGLVDELCLTVSPLFAAGANPRGLLAPGPTGGDERFELRHVLEEDGFLFLRYVRSPERPAAPPPR